jgi:hypothetical protein
MGSWKRDSLVEDTLLAALWVSHVHTKAGPVMWWTLVSTAACCMGFVELGFGMKGLAVRGRYVGRRRSAGIIVRGRSRIRVGSDRANA